MDQPLILPADILQIGPEPLLDIDVGPVERAQIILVLRLHDVTEIRFHQRGAMLKRPLHIGNAAQKLDFVGCESALPVGPPLNPVLFQIPEVIRLMLQGCNRVVRLRGQLKQRPVMLVERFDHGFERRHGFAVEDHLIAHKPSAARARSSS